MVETVSHQEFRNEIDVPVTRTTIFFDRSGRRIEAKLIEEVFEGRNGSALSAIVFVAIDVQNLFATD
jgi:hypothetical protein